jgi:4-hydroxy-L-threonine phosphate dehydrogenase PdxA
MPRRGLNVATLMIRGQGSPRIAFLLGDCTGVGPELCARVLADGRLNDAGRLVVVGDARVLEQGVRDAGVSLSWHAVSCVDEIDWSRPDVPIIDLKNIDPAGLPRGVVSAESGRLTGETLAHAIDMARQAEVDAITFAPLNKAQDVRPSLGASRLLLRDERPRQSMDVARDLACLSTEGSRPD